MLELEWRNLFYFSEKYNKESTCDGSPEQLSAIEIGERRQRM